MKVTYFTRQNDVISVTRRTTGKLFKNRNVLKFGRNHFCFDGQQGFPHPHTKFKPRFIFDQISSGRKLQRLALNFLPIRSSEGE